MIYIYIDVFVEDHRTGKKKHCNNAIYTFVAVDQLGNPISVPELIPETKEEKTPSHESSKGGGSRDAISSSTDQKLDKIYDVLNHIRWIGLSIGGMFALTFIVPQCSGG